MIRGTRYYKLTVDDVRKLTFAASVAYAEALRRGRPTQEAELHRLKALHEGLQEYQQHTAG